jgi:hypothetical protein
MKTIRLRRGFTEITRIYDLISGYGFIAGGYARYCASPKHDPYPAGDLDIFPLRKEGCFEPVRDKFLALGFTLYKENDVSYSFKKAPEGWEEVPSIQLIKPADEARMLTYGSPEEILNNFDFSVTRAAILSATEVMVDDDFEKDEASNLLTIKNIHCPVSSLLRCCKYSKKGYFLRPFEAMKLFEDWQNRDGEHRAKLKEFIVKASEFDPEKPGSGLSQEDVEHLEKMMMID